LYSDSVAVEEDAFDQALRGGQVHVMVELKEGRVCASRASARRTVNRVTGKVGNVGSCPFEGSALVPEAVVAQRRAIGQLGQSGVY
jgi:hypothetical protein